MSGDMRVRSNIDGGLGGAARTEDIDAHSSQAGDFTERRSISGKDVFFTPEGAQRYDAHLAQGYRYEALDDPKGFFERLAAPGEFAKGRVAP